MDTLLFYASYLPGGLLLVALVLLGLAVDRGLVLARASGPSSRLTEALRPMLEAGDLAAALSTTATQFSGSRLRPPA